MVEAKRIAGRNRYSLVPLPHLLAEPENARTPKLIALEDILDTIGRAREEDADETSETRIPATRRAGLARVA